MSWGARKSDRVVFARGHVVHIMGIDGTWRRTCTLLDVSATGARLTVEGSIEGLALKDFFFSCCPRPALPFAAAAWSASMATKSASNLLKDRRGRRRARARALVPRDVRSWGRGRHAERNGGMARMDRARRNRDSADLRKMPRRPRLRRKTSGGQVPAIASGLQMHPVQPDRHGAALEVLTPPN
jgi:hypothetical protein